MDQYNLEAKAKQAEQIAYLQQLSQDNFQLRDVLGPVIDRIEGRRLWQRTEAHSSHYLEDNILASTAFGNAPIAGLTLDECQVLCAAIDGGNNGGKGITDTPGGLKLQCEGHEVLYRNIWIKKLNLTESDTDFDELKVSDK